MAVAGCGPTYVWINHDRPLERWQSDVTECRDTATREVPEDQKSVQIGGGYRQPTYTNCTGNQYSVQCISTGGNYVPPIFFSYDANSSAKDDAVESCLYKRGWQKVEKQVFQSALAAGKPVSETIGCRSSEDCETGLTCRSKRGGGTHCADGSLSAQPQNCRSSADCQSGFSCRSRKGGGTQCLPQQ